MADMCSMRTIHAKHTHTQTAATVPHTAINKQNRTSKPNTPDGDALVSAHIDGLKKYVQTQLWLQGPSLLSKAGQLAEG